MCGRGVTRMGGDTGPLTIEEDRGLRGAALRGGLGPGRVRGRQAGRAETPIPGECPITHSQCALSRPAFEKAHPSVKYHCQRRPIADLADFKTCHPEHSGFRVLKRAISRNAPSFASGQLA